jgi:hypothetical protein
MPNMTEAQVLQIARSELSTRGLDPDAYEADARPPGSFAGDPDIDDADVWTVFFEGLSRYPGDHHTVDVNDGSGAATYFAGR